MEVRTDAQSQPSDQRIIDRLAHAASLAKTDQGRAGSAYQVSGEWTPLINAERAFGDLRHTLENMFRSDGHTEIGANFSAKALDGVSIKGLVKKLLITHGLHQDLRVWRALIDNPALEALSAPPIGSPWGVMVDETLIYPGVCRAHYFATHVANLLDNIGIDGVVAEIGGGYGEFAYRLLRMRPAVRYICFDLPEVLLRSSYFLMSAFPEKRFLLYDEIDGRPLSQDLIDRYDVVLMPNFMLPTLADRSIDVMVNMRSLSEMGRATVDEYIRHICRVTRTHFVHENSNEAQPSYGGHVEIPASQFPIPRSEFVKVYGQKSPWWAGAGSHGRYVEYLYSRHNPD